VFIFVEETRALLD